MFILYLVTSISSLVGPSGPFICIFTLLLPMQSHLIHPRDITARIPREVDISRSTTALQQLSIFPCLRPWGVHLQLSTQMCNPRHWKLDLVLDLPDSFLKVAQNSKIDLVLSAIINQGHFWYNFLNVRVLPLPRKWYCPLDNSPRVIEIKETPTFALL